MQAGISGSRRRVILHRRRNDFRKLFTIETVIKCYNVLALRTVFLFSLHGGIMPIVNVIYHTRSRHTEKIAEAIAREAGIEAINISEPHTLPETDLLFIGTGIYAGKPDDLLIDYLDQLPVNRIRGAAIFSTSAAGSDKTELIVNMLTHKGIAIYPERFTCRGKFLFLAKGHPDEEDCRNAASFARKVLNAYNG